MAQLYRGMDRAALDAAYNNSAAVAGSAETVAGWRRRSEISRVASKELSYGAAERNRIDYFEAAPGAPLLVFIHGGYWQMRLDGIVAEVAAALDFLARPLVVSGWSAGGHLTAMMMGHPNVRGGLAISGIFDLEPSCPSCSGNHGNTRRASATGCCRSPGTTTSPSSRSSPPPAAR